MLLLGFGNGRRWMIGCLVIEFMEMLFIGCYREESRIEERRSEEI